MCVCVCVKKMKKINEITITQNTLLLFNASFGGLFDQRVLGHVVCHF